MKIGTLGAGEVAQAFEARKGVNSPSAENQHDSVAHLEAIGYDDMEW